VSRRIGGKSRIEDLAVTIWVRTDTEKDRGPRIEVRDPQPTDTGFELTMLNAGDLAQVSGQEANRSVRAEFRRSTADAV